MAKSRLTYLINQLKRRRVFQVTSVYLVAAWTISLGAAELFPAFGVAEWVIRFLVVGLLLLLPVVVGLAWYFEVTAEGIIRDPQDLDLFATTHVGRPDDEVPAVQVSWSTENGPNVATFTHRFQIGRDIDCDVPTLDPLASRHHAEVEYRDGAWWIRDLDSRNGTYLNDQRIRRTKLSSKAVIRLGEHGQEVQLRVFGRSTTTVVAGQPRR
ncbi:MAG: FHA domain-containing protein [Proteobacteria bacterium]|nr:FHA domain-containing protein [Pseudomonadota bacterium]